MNVIEKIEKAFNTYLKNTFNIDENVVKQFAFNINVDTTKEAFGDINLNHAMILAKLIKQNPIEVAKQILQDFKHEYIEKMEIAAPGFLNLFLTNYVYKQLLNEIVNCGNIFFKPDKINKKKFNIEFVSANPTGPLHLGHGRGGIIGDVLGNILKFIGHDVTKEFYVNDAGEQMKKLGRSFKVRCQQAAHIDTKMPEDGYQGEYLLDLANQAVNKGIKQILDQPDLFFESYAKEKMLEKIKKTLSKYGIAFDIWFSEKSLHTSGAIEKSVSILEKQGYLFEQDDALWFRSTAFGDDKDRVVRKSSGEFTYMAPDIAYLENKVDRGYNHIIMILGHDHHNFATRLQGIREALGIKPPLEIILYQLVKMKEGEELVRMSKRSGKIIGLEDIIETVGKDVARFFYLNRKFDAQLQFDLNLAVKKTDENPVYYVQYAYVRTKSILGKASSEKFLDTISKNDANHIDKSEHFLIKKIISLKSILETIHKNHQIHLLAYYVIELANVFHSYYSKNRVIDTNNPEISRGRLLLIQELKNTFELCLDLLGISKPEKM